MFGLVSFKRGFVFLLLVLLFVSGVSALGYLAIGSTPSGASVYVNGVYKGLTPVFTNVTGNYTHNVTLSKTGYYIWQGLQFVPEGQLVQVNATLIPILSPVGNGTFIFNSNPSGANIYVNGLLRGVTPRNVSLPGNQNYSIRFAKSGYYDYLTDRYLPIGGYVSVFANLVPVQSSFCFDSDGGFNVSLSGYVNSSSGFYSDYCYTSTAVVEYACGVNNSVVSSSIGCPAGNVCQSGRCVYQAPPQTHLACVNMACVSVNGSGTNACGSNMDCYYLGCENNVCKKLPGNLNDSCYTEGAKCKKGSSTAQSSCILNSNGEKRGFLSSMFCRFTGFFVRDN